MLQRVQELPKAVHAELAANGADLPADARSALEQLRTELAEFGGAPPVTH